MKTKNSLLEHVESLYTDDPKINNLFVVKELNEGDYIFRQGQIVNSFYVIKKGLVKCFISEENDKDYILAFRGKGETLGEAEIIQNARCCCNVQATEETVAYRINSAMFLHRVDTDIVFNGLVLKGLAGKLQKLAARSATQQLQSSKDLLQNSFIFFQKHHLPLTKKDLADYLAITVRSLNRTLKELDENPFIIKGN